MSKITAAKALNDLNREQLKVLCESKLALAKILELPSDVSMDHIAQAIHQQRNPFASEHQDLVNDYLRVRQDLILRNQKLIYDVLYRRGNAIGTLDPDVVADAQVGLIRSIDKFDAIRFPHLQLSTYACYWIMHDSQNRRAHHIGKLAVSRRAASKTPALYRYIEARTHQEGREVNLQTIAEELGLPWQQVHNLVHRRLCRVSPHLPEKRGHSEREDIDDRSHSQRKLELLRELATNLSDQQQRVLGALYFDQERPSVRTLAKQMGLSHSRILKIKSQGIAALRSLAVKKFKEI